MLEHEGKMYARVSEIIEPFGSLPMNIKKVRDRTETKAGIGTEVHKCIESDILDIFPTVCKQTAPYFFSYRQWKDKLNISFSQSEKRYYCRSRMITGQIDTLISFPASEGKLFLCDFKTASSEDKAKWPLQAHAYFYLLQENGIAVSDRMYFVKLSKEGSFPKVYEYTWDKNIHAKFIKACDDFWDKKNNS